MGNCPLSGINITLNNELLYFSYQIGTNLRDDNTFSHTLVGMKNRINPIKEDLAIFNKITYAFTL